MKRMANRAAFMAVAVFVTAGAAYAMPLVSNVAMEQQEGSRTVTITYDLADEGAIITLGIETNGVAIPDSAVTRLSGDVCKLVNIGENKSIIWNAGADWPEHMVTNARARVTAWSTNSPPLYCEVDVAGGTAAGSYPVYYYVSAGAVPNGVTDVIYKTTSILMRKIPPTGGRGFQMGSPGNEIERTDNEDWHNVVLTGVFYAGVYQITQSQWYQVMGTWPSRFKNNDYRLTRPVEMVTYNDIRGSSAGAGWPSNDDVDVGSFMGKLRTKAGLAGFDLPTEAQWEYACRAGTSGAFNDGTVNIESKTFDTHLNALGRYAWNGGKINGLTEPDRDCTTDSATMAVGAYTPNTWGLYDMHGNISEFCLDWYVDSLGIETVIDPKGPAQGATRVHRGSCWYYPAPYCRSAYRHSHSPSDKYYLIGFRLMRNLP